jgi:hypothetical protein
MMMERLPYPKVDRVKSFADMIPLAACGRL